tara:strand:- start:138 stop:593 length:456 start_codon:yes stop_codon:yes gene_type:complete
MMRKVWNNISSGIKALNSSKFLTGVIVILMNVGSRYVDFGFSKTQEHALRTAITREIILFAAIFMATRDLILSFILTASFIIMANHILNEESALCIMPETMKKISYMMDINDDNIITPKEEREALEILRKAKKQKQKEEQINFVSYLQNTI